MSTSRLDGNSSGPTISWADAVNAGRIPGTTRVQLFGRNPAVGTAAFEDIWFNGGLYNFLTTAAPLRIRAGGDPADTALGLGARLIQLNGLDENWDPVSELVATNGAGASALTAASFFRVNDVQVVESGAYGAANTGAIIIENAAGTIVANIETEFGITQLGIYSLRRNALLWWTGIKISVDSNQAADVRTHARAGADQLAAPFGVPLVREFTGLDGILIGDLQAWTGTFTGPADMWFSAQATGGAGSSVTVQAEFYIQDT